LEKESAIVVTSSSVEKSSHPTLHFVGLNSTPHIFFFLVGGLKDGWSGKIEILKRKKGTHKTQLRIQSSGGNWFVSGGLWIPF
jgi:hypothetical protein